MPLKWRTILIADERYESPEVLDVTTDGVLDIVSSAYWHEGPDFKKKHQTSNIGAEGEHDNDFSTISLDINGDGRIDYPTGGWWGQTLRWRENPGVSGKEWPEHIVVECGNINEDVVNDLIVGQAHDYGLDWREYRLDGGKHRCIKHPIDPFDSQYHDLWWTDIGGDKPCELVAGKRSRAHCDGDPSAFDDVGSYYFKWNGESFSKQVIDYGPARCGKGFVIHLAMADLTGNGLPDIIAPGKDGLYVFYNEGE